MSQAKDPAIKQIDPALLKSGGILPRVLAELQMSRDNPRLLIIVSSGFVELMLATLIEKHCKHGKSINKDSSGFPLSVRITLLHELGIITDLEYDQLNWLRKLRNRAAHDADFRFGKEHLPSWSGTLVYATDSLPEQLFMKCITLIGLFWNARVELFREKLPIDA